MHSTILLNYQPLHQHARSTRSTKTDVKLPKCHLDFARDFIAIFMIRQFLVYFLEV